ncbi:MAG: type II secretion system protein [Clostridia bacterium]|nr:type II secretion system protein [Clostridia bacterium]
MKKTLIVIIVTLTIVGGIIGSLIMMNKTSSKAKVEKTENLEIAEKVTDDCIDEYNELETADVEETNSEEEKVSPNAIFTFEKYYKECEHTVKRYEEVPSNLVNSSKEDIEKKYDKWTIKEFSKEKIVLHQDLEGMCGEHYMLRDVEGKINIYKLDDDGNEELINETDIATEYLTQTDMIDIENGLIVYGKENLNQLLEDFE